MKTILETTKGVSNKIVDYKVDPRLSTKTKLFLESLDTGGPALETLTVKAAQKVLVDLQKDVIVDLSGIEVFEKTITSDGHAIKLHVVRPQGVKEKLPAFIFIHGGGWVLGDFPTHERMVRDLVVLSGMACVFVNYSLTPEAPYPKAINEIYTTTKWVSENGHEINVDGSKLALAGNSAGANMVIATCLKAKKNNGPQIKFQLLMWPVVDFNFETHSYKQFRKGRFLTTSLIKWMFDMYIPDVNKRKEIYASPLQASIEQLKGLPPTFIQVAENDVLRDEGEAFGQKLDEAGVETTTVRYNGMIHDFGLLNSLAMLPQTRAALMHAASELKKHLL